MSSRSTKRGAKSTAAATTATTAAAAAATAPSTTPAAFNSLLYNGNGGGNGSGGSSTPADTKTTYIPMFHPKIVPLLLEINGELIKLCTEFQNKGWTDEPEFAVYQQRLQKNLVFLATVADHYLCTNPLPPYGSTFAKPNAGSGAASGKANDDGVANAQNAERLRLLIDFSQVPTTRAESTEKLNEMLREAAEKYKKLTDAMHSDMLVSSHAALAAVCNEIGLTPNSIQDKQLMQQLMPQQTQSQQQPSDAPKVLCELSTDMVATGLPDGCALDEVGILRVTDPQSSSSTASPAQVADLSQLPSRAADLSTATSSTIIAVSKARQVAAAIPSIDTASQTLKELDRKAHAIQEAIIQIESSASAPLSTSVHSAAETVVVEEDSLC
ncbi:hypothetical protein GQ42DRAFT_157271 [Ramicandelaber brevisporus]|nr:hypothetical protein GQ42DRAFT_180205 [Ramicandelaber brevisporus]KAI8868200.1 hypothetical protein GQ42DRAFT_157271 [Ramicandelaber brevisporus]